jgi:hypothetical protein
MSRRPTIGPDGPSSFVLALAAAWYGYMILVHGNAVPRFDAWMFAHDEAFRANVLLVGFVFLLLSPFLLTGFVWLWGAAWRALGRAIRYGWHRWQARKPGGKR